MASKRHQPRKPEPSIPNQALPSMHLGMRAGDFRMGTLSRENSPWYESQEEVEAALEKSTKTRAEAAAVIEVMRECLTPSEFKAMQLHYLYNMPYRQIGLIMERNASTAYRYVQRAIKKLRKQLELPES